jgi:cytoskeletal protein CcmA (bactofilin family)
MKRLAVILLVGLASFATVVQAEAQSDDRKDSVTSELGSDHFVAGQNVTVSSAVNGDLLAAGREVTVEQQVGGDLAAAGGTLRLNGTISNNTYAAGGQIFVNGTMARNARIAGGTIELTPSSRIEGGASIAGGEIRVNGSIGKYLQATGRSVYINGPVDGDVEAAGGQIELGPNARIGGKLRYRSRSELKQDAGAQVLGGIERLPLRGRAAGAVARGFAGALFVFWTLGLMLLLAILLIAFPGFGNIIGMLETRPGMSAVVGFALLVCVPVASVILFITLIGAPLGLLSLIAYGALLMVGYLAAAAVVGDLLLKRLHVANAEAVRWRIAAAICGILIISVLGAIPALGGLVVFVALIMGMGAVGLQVNRTLRPVTH